MADNKTYKVIEIVGTSDNSFSDAVTSAVEKAAKTVDQMGWFKVTEQRGRIENNSVTQFQVKVKIGFRLKD